MVYGNREIRFEGTDRDHPGESYNDIAARFVPFIGRLEEIHATQEKASATQPNPYAQKCDVRRSLDRGNRE